jgi:hypothetical protein
MSEIPNYILVEKEDIDYYGFKIQEGEYKDVIYYYGEVKIEEHTDKDQAVLNFNYQIDKGNEKYSIEELQDSIKFNNLMGDILAEVLDKDNDERPADDNSQ